MKKKPIVTVLLPVYNGRRYISKAVGSILNQTFTNFEFIIINDGSTDGTKEILEDYAKKDSRIKLISRENKGLVATLNEGIDLTTTPLIARMDADDIAIETRLSEQVEYLDNNPEVVCVGSFIEVIDKDDRALTVLEAPTSNTSIKKQLIKGHTVICHPTALMRKNAILEVGKYKEENYLVEDLDLWLRLGEIGRLSNIPKVLMKYRVLISSISGSSGNKQFNMARKVIEDTCLRRGIVSEFELTQHFRPSSSKMSQYKFILKYGWWAFKYKNRSAAIVYGVKAVKLYPLNAKSWQLLYCAFFKI